MYVAVAPIALVWLAPAGAAGWVAAFAAVYAAVGGLLLRALSREDRDRLAALVRERTAELEAARTLALESGSMSNSGPGATMRVVLPLAVSVTTRRAVTERGVA
jgi:hypothetical protein